MTHRSRDPAQPAPLLRSSVGEDEGERSDNTSDAGSGHGSNHNTWLTVVLLLLALAAAGMLVVRFIITPVGRIDDAIPLMFGRLILQGHRPMVDFHSPYPPVTYYLTAGAMWLIGPSVLADRLVRIVLYGVLLVAVAGYLRRTRQLPWVAVAGWGLGFVVLVGDAFWYISFVAAAFGTLGLLALLHGLSQRGAWRTWWLLLCGLLIGLCGLSRSNFGVDFAFAAMALLVTRALWQRHRPQDPVPAATDEVQPPLRRLVIDAFTVFTPTLLCGLFFAVAYRDAIGDLWEQLVVFPGRLVPHRIRRMETPAAWIMSALPLVWIGLRGGWRPAVAGVWVVVGVLFALGLTLLSISSSTQPLLPAAGFVGALLVWGGIACSRRIRTHEALWLLALGGFLHYYLSRTDPAHLAPLLILGALLLTTLHEDLFVHRRRSRGPAAVLALLLVLAAVPTQSFYLQRRAAGKSQVAAAAALLLDGKLLPEGDAAYVEADERIPLHWPQMLLYPDLDELKATRFVRERTAPQEAVYVGDVSHATLYTATPRTYWLLDRPPAVKRFTLEPGVNTEAAEQERMIEALARRRVDWIILVDLEYHDPDFDRRAYRGADLLDGWIADQYVPIEQFGRYQVLRRRP